MLDVRSNAAQTDQDLDIGYPAQPIDRIQAGREAWDRLSKHRVLDDWFVLGQALVIGRTEAFKEARTNKPAGRRYNEAIGVWLRETGFINIHKTIRSRTLELLDHRSEVEVFLATLPPEKQIKLNHPATILSAWKRSLVAGQQTKKTLKPELSAAWNKADFTTRYQWLSSGDVELTELLAVMPETMLEEIKARVLGQHGGKAPPRSVDKTLTHSLHHSLSILSTNKQEAIDGLTAIMRKLADHKLTLHDVAVTIVKRGAHKRAS